MADDMTAANALAMAEGAIFADEVKGFLSSIDDPSIYRPLELPGQEWARFILGGKDNPAAPQVWIVKLPPNFVVPRHYHKTNRLEVMLRGSYTLDGKERGAGAITFFTANEVYGPIVIGPEGGITREVFSTGIDMGPIFTEEVSPDTYANLARMGMTPRFETGAKG